MSTRPGDASVAVVGGGMFGIAAALALAARDFAVTLFERNDDILLETSGSNQFRLHRGYHYPRSERTARQCLRSEARFRERFGESVVRDRTHHYAIAAEGSKTSPTEFVDFCDRLGLEYRRTDTPLLDDGAVAFTAVVREHHVDHDRLRELCRDRLERSGVRVRLDTNVASPDDLDRFDFVVVATYANLNRFLVDYPSLRREYEFEVCELPVVDLPEEYVGNNLIVLDGPFMSVDHFGDSDRHLMGDYHHMVHSSNTGPTPVVDEEYERLVNEGVVEDPSVTNFEAFRDHGREFMPGIADALHRGSLFTVRAKLPNVEATDARPSIVKRQGDVVSVFGGKIATSLLAAERVVDCLT